MDLVAVMVFIRPPGDINRFVCSNHVSADLGVGVPEIIWDVAEVAGVFVLGFLVGMLLRRLIEAVVLLLAIAAVVAALGALNLPPFTSVFSQMVDTATRLFGEILAQAKTAPQLTLAFILGLVVGLVKG
jgi:glucan phosphoethanolaminetransferase (alkaline phosphatase superfamily)